ncbi:acyl-CoA synthetase family protein [Algicola sagamiensis]|uniref:AMP-binding protein n=1 Tax=Algicola sagamiensis TaxID=163869 RepID=UPI00036C6B4F|nr:AMP-binding protein [Algicola sagamiensis]
MKELYEGNIHGLSPRDVIDAAMRWHFHPETGSPYWLEKLSQLDFDPLTDIHDFSDLQRFPDITNDWKTLDVTQLIPKGCLAHLSDFHVFESGGTTGNPKRIVEHTSRKHALGYVEQQFSALGYQSETNEHWLHLGPTGPHIVGRTIKELARRDGKLCFQVDFDPRWVKKLILQGKQEEVSRYKHHLLQQAYELIRTQEISILFITPPLLEAICQDPQMLACYQEKIKSIIWAGTSISSETYHLITTHYFPNVIFMGLYGNTMMGIAPQRPPFSEDDEACVYQPLYPFCRVHFVDPQTQKETAYGEYGQLCVSLITPELFIPNNLERDYAKRVRSPGFPHDGIANVGPLPGKKEAVTEGVY